MKLGTITRWTVKEGDEVGSGDIYCEIETDKANVDFECQEDGFIAKILAPEGTADIVVGTPILVTVEESNDVAAFKDFVADAAPVLAAEPEPEPVALSAPVATQAKAAQTDLGDFWWGPIKY